MKMLFLFSVTISFSLLFLFAQMSAAGKPIPVYGKGENVRDWLFVEDHASALECVATTGRVGESYNIGCRVETTGGRTYDETIVLPVRSR